MPPPDYVPFTLEQKYSWTFHKLVNPGKLLYISASAALEDRGGKTYETRVASRWGIIAVRENLAFGIRAFDHEDPRYFRCTSTGVWNRTRYAIAKTFVVKNDSGGNMPAYSMLLSSFAAPYVAQNWHPNSIHRGREAPTGTIGIGVAVLGNVGREFWPDIKKKLRR